MANGPQAVGLTEGGARTSLPTVLNSSVDWLRKSRQASHWSTKRFRGGKGDSLRD